MLQLTHSGLWLGLATAARYLPVLLLTPYAGLIVDRADKRTVLLITQASLAALSLILGALVLLGAIHLWMVFAIALAFGVLTALDNPARMAFIPEIVGPRLIRNAVTLNSTFVNVGRAVGPVVAAVLVAGVGIGWCFVVNGLSFAGVLAALLTLDTSQLRTGRSRRASRSPAARWSGLRARGARHPRSALHDGADRHLYLRVRGQPPAVRARAPGRRSPPPTAG